MTVLLTPGPVDVSPEVLEASMYMCGHRTDEFRDIVGSCTESLEKLAGADHVAVTTGSGTLAVESVIYSYLKKGEHVLNISYGEFGNRLGDSLRRRGCEARALHRGEEEVLRYEDIEEILDSDHDISAVTIVHNETGNGTAVRNLGEITARCKNAGLKVIVDSVSGFAALPISVEGMGIDVFATCGHKGIASVPGAAIVAMGKECYDSLHSEDVPNYLDLSKSIHFMKKNETPYTPSVGTFKALSVALDLLEKEGIGRRLRRTSEIAEYARRRLVDSGYGIAGSKETFSDSVINIILNGESGPVVSKLAESGYIVSRGMGERSASSIRVGVMGNVSKQTVDSFLDILFSHS